MTFNTDFASADAQVALNDQKQGRRAGDAARMALLEQHANVEPEGGREAAAPARRRAPRGH